MELKSMSEGDLVSIAKKMIIGALENKEHLTKLHRAIHEELCFEAIRVLEMNKNKKAEISCRTISPPESPANKESMEFPVSDVNRDASRERYLSSSEKSDKENIKDVNSENSMKKSEMKNPGEICLRESREIDRKDETKILRSVWKRQRIQKQRELITDPTEIQKTLHVREPHVRRKKFKAPRRNIDQMEKKGINDECLKMLRQVNEKITANQEACRARDTRTSMELRRYQPRREIQIVKNYNDFKFDAWMNQLDSVLHQKHTRERRYLVRSFYRQPACHTTPAVLTN